MILKWAAAIALSVAAVVLGAWLGRDIPNAAMWHFVLFALQLVCIILSPVLSFVWGKKLEKLKVRERMELAEARKEAMARDEQKERRRLEWACRFTVCYLVMLTLFALGSSFFCGASGVGIGSSQLIGVYILYGIVGRFIRKKEKDDFSEALPRADFPELYRMAEEATGAAAQQNSLHIYVLDNVPDEEGNVSVTQRGNHILLAIGTALLCTLDRNQMQQIVRHEIAHIDHNDVGQMIQYNRLLSFLSGDDNGDFAMWTDLALQFPINLLAYEGMFYFQLASVHKETAADARVKDLGDSSAMTGALALTTAHDLYVYENPIGKNYFEQEQPPVDFATRRARAYREALQANAGRWMDLLERELPSRRATHPSFRQRWEALGCCDYDLMPAAHDDAYGAECWAAAAVCDKRRAQEDPAAYTQLRQEHYLAHVQTVEAFEAAGTIGAPEEMRPVVLAYLSLGMADKAEALCDALIEANDSLLATAFSRYWKGYFLLHRFDPAGLAYIYQAIDTNRNYIRSGLDEIGHFCVLMGLEAELEEYRRRAPEYMQTEDDWDSDRGISARAKLQPDTLPDNWLERIRDYIVESGGGSVSHIYLVRETVGQAGEMSAFILRFADGTDDKVIEKTYERVFRLLDDWPVDWEFSLYIFEPAMEKVLARIPGACVYDAGT